MRRRPSAAVSVAVRAKGAHGTVQRAFQLAGRMGTGRTRMTRRVHRLAALAGAHDCPLTLFVTASVFERHADAFADLPAAVELAAHGDAHVDLAQLSPDAQVRDLTRARQRLVVAGVDAVGHRGPYLHPPTVDEGRLGFRYEAGHAVFWKADGLHEVPRYARALDFYGARAVDGEVVLPCRARNQVALPYCLPDDEALVDRIGADTAGQRTVWRAMLDRTVEAGGLLVLGVHPERLDRVEPALISVLDAAQRQGARLWRASLADIAAWWWARESAGPRWPEGARAAFALSGDVDAMALRDYVVRVSGR